MTLPRSCQRPHPARSPDALGVAGLVFTLLLVACGGGGGGASGASAGAAASTPSATAPETTPGTTSGSTTSITATAFRGDILLGSPTPTSIKANVHAADQSGTVWIVYGSSPDALMRQTERQVLRAGTPVEFTLSGLQGDMRHHYRLHYQAEGQSVDHAGEVLSFQTARRAGSTFSFTLQGDSHPERANQQFNAALYVRTLDTIAANPPDFHILMGDDFSIDTIDPARITRALVTERYTQQRPWLTRVAKRSPLFLVNGNHEQAARYLLDGTPENVAVWAQTARNSHYAQPSPDGYYSGNTEQVPFIGLLRNHHAWTWGDALFVVLDPYWASPVPVDNVYGNSTRDKTSMWEVTHGDAQYEWLKRTLEGSQARYKFVLAHHVMGGGRGGIELADRWEWGGRNTRGVDEFRSQRPTWAMPIHQLFVTHRVNIFFQGHDHVWVRQQLDGVTYQTLPQPADSNYALNFDEAYTSGEKHPNSGYTRVTVSPTQIRVEYIRSVLPVHETAARQHGSVVTSYTLP